MDPATNPMANKSESEIKGLLGTIRTAPMGYQKPAISNGVPSTFDSRTQWGDCVHPIRDQAQCGSCWAFGASEALSDRFCISSNGKTNVVLSPEDLVACDTVDQGCNGGYLSMAWRYLTNTGIVTDTCFPYSSGSGTVPHCPHGQCQDTSEDYVKYKCTSGSIVEATTVDEIKSEIYAHGPMETAFDVYEDFMNYKSGVYHHVTGKLDGGHAVKILGWGTESGMDYWLCANSWGTSWGIDGFFKIKQGDCGIDSAVYACTPKL
jgi:cathepsin B